jgi:O-antigen ligase
MEVIQSSLPQDEFIYSSPIASWDLTCADLLSEAHNGILEMLLEIGFLGSSFFIFLWVRNFVIATKCMNGPARQIGLLQSFCS